MVSESIQLINSADKALRIADHMIYITYPLIKENKLLKSVLEQIYGIADNIIKAVLHYEWTFKRIGQPATGLFTSNSRNFELLEKCTERYNITSQEIEQLKALIDLRAKHNASSIEFTRKDKLVFISNSARAESIGLEELKKYLILLKSILRKSKAKINLSVWQSS